MIPWYLVLKDNSITHIQAIYHESFIEEKFRGFLGIHETFSTNIALFKHCFKRMREEDKVDTLSLAKFIYLKYFIQDFKFLLYHNRFGYLENS